MILGDPLLELAYAAAVFAPQFDQIIEDMDDELDGDEFVEGLLEGALHGLRIGLPSLYAEAVAMLNDNVSESIIRTHILSELHKTGLQFQGLASVAQGNFYLPAFGIVLENPETYDMYPQLKPILEVFGVEFQNPYNIDIPEGAYTVGQAMARDLRTKHPENFEQIPLWCFLAWVFGSSNNTLVDFDEDGIAEMGVATDWSDAQFYIEMIDEAETFIKLALFEMQDPDLPLYRKNAHAGYKELAKAKQNGRQPDFKFDWG